MTVFGVSMVRDEADIAPRTVEHMARQVDHVIVADNGSTDGTRELLERLPCEVIDDPDPAYYQSRKMSELAARAREQGADWVIPFDADELWLARDGRAIANVLADQPEHVMIAAAALYDHVASDEGGSEPITRMPWRRPEPAPLPKVACRALPGLTIHQGNHGASYHGQDHPPAISNLLIVHHYPLRSVAQMIRKARTGGAAYAATDLPEDVGAHWRGWDRLSDEQIAEVFREFYWSADPAADGLVRDPVAA